MFPLIRKTILTIAVSACLPVIANTTSTLNEIEHNIVTQTELLLPQTLKELEQAVNINSGSMNFTGVKQVGALAKLQLEDVGFKVEWLDGRHFNRAGHIVATHESANPNAPKIVMIGHLDTVFEADDDFQTFTRLSETEASGPGVADMKGGNAIIIAAMRILNKLDLLKDLSIKIVLTGDEESSGEPLTDSKQAIVDAAIWADIALGFENGDNDINTAMAARRGYTGWELAIKAKPAHSSRIFNPEIGYGAIFEAARILDAFREQLSSEENLTFNPGMIVGGTRIDYQKEQSSGTAFGKSNVIAQEVKVIGDLRALSVLQVEQAMAVMQKIVAAKAEHSQAELTFETGYPPMALTKGNLALLAIYDEVSRDLGYNKVVAANPRQAGAADISFAANHVEMALDGLGLMGQGAHTKDEIADLTSLKKNIEKTTILLYRLAQAANVKTNRE
ncbi:M20/M25/M40 family metallo-hydrolase [Pseudoalteromonas tunicata]|uniref:M20/M25/M40 family metallo-hydrolase n=1 Tax=Pseudoalteromonas tunicata TaxID=314281 RepID=UPI00273F1855|nr:M20/M25/M40 family metallo-hydrolase [Pseudoalteromonas tunicata]MDP5212870.1 M20/M25/M40 family metallo-hydrolase [Pseudoalteromonas tunicata]